MDRLRVLGIACALSVLVSAGSWVWTSRHDHQRSCENREAIVQAFDLYTNALIAAAGRNEDRTPAEEQERAETIKVFRATVREELAPLRAGC